MDLLALAAPRPFRPRPRVEVTGRVQRAAYRDNKYVIHASKLRWNDARIPPVTDGVHWIELPEMRVRVKIEGGVEGGRWRFPRR